jgi:hypothetical protein
MSQTILIPLATVASVVAVVLLALVAVVLRDPRAAARRVEALFRKPPRPAAKPGSDHDYKPYWS